MTDIAGIRENLDDHRLELLRRRLSERRLRSVNPKSAELSSNTGLDDGQRRLWFIQMADPTGAILNICLSYRLIGALDLVRLRDAVNAVAGMHEILRTTYRAGEDGEPRRIVHDDLRPGWSIHDLSELSDHARRLRLKVLAQREFSAPFDLGSDSPLRLAIVRTGADEHVMLLAAHHIAWDDGCWRVFFADLTRAYGGERLAPPQPQHEAIDRAAEDDLEYWRSVMTDPPEPLELPGPNGTATPSTWRSRRTTLQLSESAVDRAEALARECGATPYMVLFAAFGVLIHRYTHAEDFLVATPLPNRPAEVEGVIGCHGNTVALRLRPRPRQTFRELVAHARDTTLEAVAHQRVSLDRVVRELNPDRRHGVDPMTRVSFGMRPANGAGFNPPGIKCRRDGLRGQFTALPLSFMVEFDNPEAGVLVEAEYLVEILDATLARQLLEHYAALVDNALDHPDRPISELDLMGDAGAGWLRRVSSGDEFHTPSKTLATLVETQVARTPDATAIVYEGRHFTYRDVNASANRLAHWLIEQDIGAEDCIALLLDRSPELVITALAVMKAGAVYLPVDPTYPEDRLSFILSDSTRNWCCENFPRIWTAIPSPRGTARTHRRRSRRGDRWRRDCGIDAQRTFPPPGFDDHRDLAAGHIVHPR